MTRAMRLGLLVVAAMSLAVSADQRSGAPSPPALARMWDAEHVSAPVSPLVDHAQVKAQVQAIGAQTGSPLIRNVSIVTGTGIPSFTGDVGIVANRRVRGENGRRTVVIQHSIDDLGDLRKAGGLFEVEGAGRVLAPAMPAVEEGHELDLPVSGFPSTLTVGAPANLMLLTELPSGRYRVDRVFR